MRIKHLSLRNIGPFIEAEMRFFDDADEKVPVVLITGENGAGKSIITDAIRGMFGPQYVRLERDIRRRKCEEKPEIRMMLETEQEEYFLNSHEIRENDILPPPLSEKHHSVMNMPENVRKGGECPNWIADFWPSASAGGSYQIRALANPEHKNLFLNALQGVGTKESLTELICHFDYLRDSRDPREQEIGERLYHVLEKIIENSLLDGGKLSHISRSTYQPVILQNGQAVNLENLSSGNLYLIQNMTGLLGKMYSVHFLRQTPLSEICQTPGILLIDEAENHLHPKWQKRFIRSVLDIFPNLQIIATTHSPFIISSVPDARLFVCKVRAEHCVVVDETSEYSNKPVDEILISPLFEGTLPFNEDISRLIRKREQAIRAGNGNEREQIETKLKAINPQYFSYLDVDFGEAGPYPELVEGAEFGL
ncbi:AAA family ATPase [Desulfobacterales bacterium HSG2]|nr:AAA family ATPase [Desulfobacterales bacterium HSG2]